MPWKDRVRAILEMWYPGQEGGWATAKLLLGLANPCGKLPVTFPMRLSDAPTGGVYSEGIAVGYRWYDQRSIEPLFPFGHGLSYTRFEYSDLAVSGSDVSFTVKNAGPRAGAEVAQVYLGPPDNAPVPMVAKALAGFERVELGPGQSRRVTVHIGARELSYWSTERHDWVVAAGRRPVYIGASSRDIRQRMTASFPPAGMTQSSASATVVTLPSRLALCPRR
jgi:beta-glucosidase